MVLHSLVLVLAAVEASACLLLCVPLPESFVKVRALAERVNGLRYTVAS
jgi:hypothetical protein